MRLALLIAGVLCCAGCCVAARGGQSYVRGPDGQLYPCGPNGCAVAPGQPANPAYAQPALPAPPVPVPERPLVPVAPKPQSADPPQRERPQPQIERLEMLNPVQVDPVGPNADSIAQSLQAIAAGVDKALPTWPPGFGEPDTETGRQGDKEKTPASAPPVSVSPGLPASQSPIVSAWAWDLLRWSLTGLAGAAGVAIPGGAAGVAVWAGWRLLRGAVRRMRMPADEETPDATAAAAASATATADASTKWYRDQLDALHRQIAGLRVQLREAGDRPCPTCEQLRRQLAETQAELESLHAGNVGDGNELAALRLQLDAERRRAAALERQLAERPVTYQHPPADDGLGRMRRAMKDVSDQYPSGRAWVRMFEEAYQCLLSGERHGGKQ